jgi:hypothetical protein
VLSKNGHIGFLSGNAIKLIACVFMFIDHLGFIFFPSEPIYRIIGRLAFPLFAFMIGEGAKHTRNKLRYFLTLAIFAAAVEGVYFLLFKSFIRSIFVTFSFSVIIIYTLDLFKRMIFNREQSLPLTVLAGILFASSVVLTYFISREFPFDYGFFGAIIPVFASIFRMPEYAPERLKLLDNHLIHVAMLGLGVLIHAFQSSNLRIQLYALLAIFILLLYSGKRGKLKMKYFFYIFYPTHIAALQIIYWIINA